MDHLRNFIQHFRNKSPGTSFPKATPEFYAQFMEVLTPHSMRIMQKDNSLFRSADAPQPFPEIDIRMLWDNSEDLWKKLHMAMVFSFFQGDPKEKVAQIMETMKRILPKTHNDTDEILKTLGSDETSSAITEIFELFMNTRLATIVTDIAASIKLEDLGINFEYPEEILETLQHPERSQAIRQIMEQVKVTLEDRIKTGKINQHELIREIETLKAKFQSSFGKYMNEMVGFRREGDATGNTADQILSNSPDARRARMQARLQRKLREKGRG
jgi:hypothetical protein